ncbi:MAG: ribosomal-processing cysteine protease Prp [Lachnospiraceae bacterium]|nr:ribosomal-processing cysteine protease Prp [Lachnospiraceae bacterium]
MTTITFYRTKNGLISGFDVDDHAGYAEEGSDIVCAAISALTINTVNSIEAFTEDDFEGEADDDNARITFRINLDHSEAAELLLQSFLLGVTNMASDEAYADYMKLEFQEV